LVSLHRIYWVCVEFITILTQVNLIHLVKYNKSLLQIVTSTFVVHSKGLTVQILVSYELNSQWYGWQILIPYKQFLLYDLHSIYNLPFIVDLQCTAFCYTLATDSTITFSRLMHHFSTLQQSCSTTNVKNMHNLTCSNIITITNRSCTSGKHLRYSWSSSPIR